MRQRCSGTVGAFSLCAAFRSKYGRAARGRLAWHELAGAAMPCEADAIRLLAGGVNVNSRQHSNNSLLVCDAGYPPACLHVMCELVVCRCPLLCAAGPLGTGIRVVDLKNK